MSDKIYYRIKINKADGNSLYTRIKVIQWENKQEIYINQDNQHKILHIKLYKEMLNDRMFVNILNINGQSVFRNDYSNQESIGIATSSWTSGYYFVQINKNDTNPVIRKIMVQN